MTSDEPVAPPVGDVPKQGVATNDHAAPGSAQGNSGEGDVAPALPTAPSAASSTMPDFARAAEAKPEAQANPSYEERRAVARQQDLEQIRQAMMDSVRAEMAKLEASKRQAEQTRLQAEDERAATAQEKAVLEAERAGLEKQKVALEQQKQAQAAQMAQVRDLHQQLAAAMDRAKAGPPSSAQRMYDKIRGRMEDIVAQTEPVGNGSPQQELAADAREKSELRLQNQALSAQLDQMRATARQLQEAMEGDEATRAAALQGVRDQVHDALGKVQRAQREKTALHARAGAQAAELAALRAAAARQQAEHEDAEARFEARRAATAHNTRGVVEKLGAAKRAAEAELAAVARALDAHDAGIAQARRAAALAGEPDTLGELGRLVEDDCVAIEAAHRRAVKMVQDLARAGGGGGGGDTAEQREHTAARVARIGGELTKIRGIRTRLTLDDALLGALRRQRQQPPRPQEEEQEVKEQQQQQHSGGGGGRTEAPKTARRGVVTPLGAVRAVALALCLAATAAEGHQYALWRVANATTRAMMAEGQYYTCVGVPRPAYFVDWLLQVLGRRP